MLSSEILTIALDVHDKRKTHTESALKEMYPEFSERYSALFEMCLSDNMNIDVLKHAMSILHLRETNQKTEHDTDVEFGEVLAQNYLHTKL